LAGHDALSSRPHSPRTSQGPPRFA
jgi:hypothetical protein